MTYGIRARISDCKVNLRWAALAISSLVLLAVVAAPTLACAGRLEAFPLYLSFQAVCHQQPERSWEWLGEPLAVCTRCFGVYGGAFAALLLGWRFSKVFFGVALLSVLATWAVEVTRIMSVPAGARWLSGMVLGFTAVSALVSQR